jgi:hypothetical protein
MKSETLDISQEFGAEYQGKYLLKEISWAKRSRIIQKYTKYHPSTGQVLSSDLIAIQAETVMASLHGQPESKPLSLAKLLDEEEGVPIPLGELLAKVANRLNTGSQEDLRFLLLQLDEESRIHLLQSLGYVKSSVGLPINLESSPQVQSTDS